MGSDSCSPSPPLTLPPVQTGILPVHATEPGPSCLPELQGHMVSQESYPLHGTMHNTFGHLLHGYKYAVGRGGEPTCPGHGGLLHLPAVQPCVCAGHESHHDDGSKPPTCSCMSWVTLSLFSDCSALHRVTPHTG